MITSTSFNEQFIAKVRAAAVEAVQRSAAWTRPDASEANQGQAYVRNRHGKLILRAAYNPNRSPAFQFLEGSTRDITALAASALGGVL